MLINQSKKAINHRLGLDLQVLEERSQIVFVKESENKRVP